MEPPNQFAAILRRWRETVVASFESRWCWRCLCGAITMIVPLPALLAQTPTATPTPTPAAAGPAAEPDGVIHGGYEIHSSAEIGYRTNERHRQRRYVRHAGESADRPAIS
jgi:hypothetical protein